MSNNSDLRRAIEAAIETHDDGDGAPMGRVIETVATEHGLGPTLALAGDLCLHGDLYTTGIPCVKVTPKRVVADGGD